MLYLDILQKDCQYTDRTIKLYLLNNVTFFNLFPYLFMSLFIHHFFSSSRINQCYQLLRYIYFFILSFIGYILFLFIYKLLGTLLLKAKPK